MKTLYFLTLIWLGSLVWAAHFTGNYMNQQAQVAVVIQHSPDGSMQGIVTQNGQQFQLQGQGSTQGAQGVLQGQQGNLGFQAQLSQDRQSLQFTILQAGQSEQGQGAQTYTLQRVESLSQQPLPQQPLPQQPLPQQPLPQQQPQLPQPPTPVNPTTPLTPTPVSPTPVSPTPVNPTTPNPLDPTSPVANPLDQTMNDPWSGTYTGNNGELTVAIESSSMGYVGYIELAGAVFPLQAQDAMGELAGKFSTADGGQFDFSFRSEGGGYVLSTGNTDYLLDKEAATPANPLDRP